MKTVILCALLALAGPAAAADISTYSFAGCAFPDTDQCASNTATLGEDHDYASSASTMSFTIYNGAAWGGAVASSVTVDNRTGLMWVTNPNDACATCPGGYVSSGTYNWRMALNQCESAVYAGFSDWRLPNIKELFSIVKEEGSVPYIDRAAFPGTVSNRYWTSTTYMPDTANALLVGFNSGTVYNNTKISTTYYIRCVRGGP